MATIVDGRSEAELLGVAQRQINKKTKPSEVLSEQAEDQVTRFALSELTIGEELGRGGFCVVKEVSKISLKKASPSRRAAANQQHDSGGGGFVQGLKRSFGRSSSTGDNGGSTDGVVRRDEDGEEIHDREFMAANYRADPTMMQNGGDNGKSRNGSSSSAHDGECRYAIKIIQSSARDNAGSFITSVMDLALEARYLAVLRHRHIIRMRAMASSSPYEEGRPFFVILDKLSDILTTRLQTWKKRMPNALCACCHARELRKYLTERLVVAYDLSTALAYLHSVKVLYRDIKPDNIGFDMRGEVKLFDFGLAREMQQKLITTEGTYLLTGGTGFPPYLAPEVALDKPYNETCDVYSFCILLWQMLHLQEPFDNKSVLATDAAFRKHVVKGGLRPKLDPKKSEWSDELNDALRGGWNEDLTKRPSMEFLSNALREAILDETGLSETDTLLDRSRLAGGKYV